jgi:endonuclease YncB( thermonuclease family)
LRAFVRSLGNLLGFLLVLAAMVILIDRLGLLDLGSGNAEAIDGDSLRLNGQEIRLHGIDAPEYRQTCRDRAGAEYACGKEAARHLREMIRGRGVSCKSWETDRYGRAVASCTIGDDDIAARMVREGWATAYLRHEGTMYALEQREARQARRGIWAGQFEQPEAYRERMRRVEGDLSGTHRDD